MSGNVFVGDHILMDVCLDAARRQLVGPSRRDVCPCLSGPAGEHAGEQ
jgi:hypothetical protein